MRMVIPKQAENCQVSQKVFEVLNFLFENNAKAVAIKVLADEKELYIKPFSYLKTKVTSNFFRVQSELKEEFKDIKFEKVAFIFAETFVEIWNKFMPMEFVFKFDAETMAINMMWDEGMNEKQIKAYWFRDDRDGYNVKGNFWSREWLKPEFKEQVDGGGKL